MSETVSEFHEIVGLVKEYINYQKMCGVDYCPSENISDSDSIGGLTIDMEDTLARELHNIGDNVLDINKIKPGDKEKDISTLIGDMSNCTKCKLARNRTKLVFGEGNLNAKLVFVGEAPGRDEDLSGRPFVGRAGKLLTKIINAMDMKREDVYILNIVKCRPPENRNPQDDEIRTCEPFMLKQLEIIKPEIICTLGTFSSQTLLKTKEPISKIRGRFFDYHGIKLMPTYHPAFLLRNQNKKREVWEDMQKIMNEFKA
jgi:DNA polymerase